MERNAYQPKRGSKTSVEVLSSMRTRVVGGGHTHPRHPCCVNRYLLLTVYVENKLNRVWYDRLTMATTTLQSSLLAAALTVAEQNKPALLKALASQNVTIENLLVEGINAEVKNPLLRKILVSLAPEILKALPGIEAAAFASLESLVKGEIAQA